MPKESFQPRLTSTSYGASFYCKHELSTDALHDVIFCWGKILKKESSSFIHPWCCVAWMLAAPFVFCFFVFLSSTMLDDLFIKFTLMIRKIPFLSVLLVSTLCSRHTRGEALMTLRLVDAQQSRLGASQSSLCNPFAKSDRGRKAWVWGRGAGRVVRSVAASRERAGEG